MGCEPELLNKKTKPAKASTLNIPVGVPPLTSLYMYIAGSCNLACRHCWISPTYEPDNTKGQFLKLEYIKKAVAEAKPLGLQSVKLTGGEPMLHPQFLEIINFLNNEKISIIVETNGTLIDQRIAKFLKTKSSMLFISVSVDGASAKTHEAVRAVKGSFKRAITGITNLARAGFKPQLICTLNKSNVHEICALISLAKKIGCGSVKFNNIQQIGRGEAFNKAEGLDIEEILELHRNLKNGHYGNNIINVRIDVPHAFYSIKELTDNSLNRCAILNILGILSNGDYSLCGIGQTVQDLVFGNAATHNLHSLWTINSYLKTLRKKIPNMLEGVCRECAFRSICMGTCIAMNYKLTKKITAPYFFCQEAERRHIFPISRKIKASHSGG